jgi:geranylgeranylglycerol-phosphate geranylgeranyltransferase
MWRQIIRANDMHTTAADREKLQVSFPLSQFKLLQSRKKWGIIFALATVTGIFCATYSGGSFLTALSEKQQTVVLASKLLLLPVASFLIIVGMYVLNDLFDADIDQINGKKRPIPLGQVSKNQALAFVILSNATGVFIAILSFSYASTVIALMIVAIGLMYSIPKIALKDRFIIKTLSIAISLMLCLLFGSTGIYSSTISRNSLYELIAPIYAASMLGFMIFVTSPLNDLGDISGDKEAGRRTIPIVIGRKNTIKMSIFLSCIMSGLSWIVYGLSPSSSNIGVITPLLVSLVVILTIANLRNLLKQLDNIDFVRNFVHSKSMPFHILLQSVLTIGSLLYWI